MYLPIPETTSVSNTVTASVPKTDCANAHSVSATASFSKPKSTVPREKTANVVVNVMDKPVSGSWSQVKESGQIKMTAMSILKEEHIHEVAGVQVPYFASAIARTGVPVVKVNGVCVDCSGVAAYSTRLAKVQGRYVEQGDLAYWKERYPDAPHFICVDRLDPSQVEKAKADAFSELFTAYNLGEEIAEFKETIMGVTKLTKEAITLILKSRQFITELLQRGLKKEAASRWMEFRYGIMPIIYSIQDIMALKGDTGLYRTVRQKVKPVRDEPPVFGHESVYFEDVGVSEVKCSITAKGRWASQELKQLDLISINPLTTYVEVYPWAMVIGWFFNVSSFINTRAKSLTSLALETAACVAIREKMEYGTYLHLNLSYNHEIIDPGDSSCGKGFYGSVNHGTYFDSSSNYLKLVSHSVDNYRRYLYQPSDVKLVWSPYFDWRRIIDGTIIASGTLSKLLRSLK